MPPLARISEVMPGMDAILAFSRDAFLLALEWVRELLVAIRTTSCCLISSATGSGGSAPFLWEGGIIIRRTLSVTSAAASYRDCPTSEHSGSVTTRTCSDGLICMQVLTTDLEAVSMASAISSVSVVISRLSSAIYFAPRTRSSFKDTPNDKSTRRSFQ